ncbi:MAG: Coenzyme F420 hydrogenase/dehydrogenase, beta subunit C-terminal domain [Candidatus Heimdallarchaeaceae archaeon]
MSSSEPRKRKRNFALLNREVIKPGYCTSCGCISCGACVDACLRFRQLEEQPSFSPDDIGPIKEVYVGKTKLGDIHKRSQNGGIVTTLLITAMNKGEIDSALVTSHLADLISPAPQLAMSEFEIKKASKSKYTLNPLLTKLTSIKLSHKHAVAVVGLPCHNETLRNIIEHKELGADHRIKYRIGLFCMSSYLPSGFRTIIQDTLGKGTTDIKIKECSGAKAPGCKYCQDFTSEYADLSIGNVGVADDNNIIIIRTEAGKELFDLALKENVLDVKKIDESKWDEALAAAKKLNATKRKIAKPLHKLEQK